jgi:hypothetical protein
MGQAPQDQTVADSSRPATTVEPANVTPLRKNPRLVVELNQKSAALLDELVELEELNKTTVVNRAIQVYAILRKAEEAGGQVLISEDGDSEPHRVRFI